MSRLSFTLTICLLSVVAGSATAAGQEVGYHVGDRIQQHTVKAKSKYKEISWDDLVPKDWDPMSDFKHLDFNKMKDSDPRAQAALVHLREVLDHAPVESALQGVPVRIPGFIVPLEVVHHRISEFLLVPYFGGCIHVPPPPANQIIHVFPVQPLEQGFQSMDAVWISGTLETTSTDTDMGSAGYQMKAETITRYVIQ